MLPASSTSSSDPALKAWLATLLLIATVELIAWATGPVSAAESGARFYPPGAQPTYEQSIIQWQYNRAMSPDLADTDVLIIGDSSALMGIDPRVIEARTALRTESLALVAFAHVHGFADALDFYLGHQPPPRLVVLGMAPFGYAVPWPAYEEYGLRTAIAGWAGADPPLWPSLALRARARATIAAMSEFPGLDAPRGERPSDNEVRVELQSRQGGMIETIPVTDWADQRPVPARVQPEALDALRRICARAVEHDFALVIIHNPVPAPLLTPTISGRLDAVATAFVEANARHHDQVDVFRVNDFFSKRTQFGFGFQNSVHAFGEFVDDFHVEQLKFTGLVAPRDDDLLARCQSSLKRVSRANFGSNIDVEEHCSGPFELGQCHELCDDRLAKSVLVFLGSTVFVSLLANLRFQLGQVRSLSGCVFY